MPGGMIRLNASAIEVSYGAVSGAILAADMLISFRR
jgi:hypothetical protein